ncbi:imidazole glycerol phosphate synthase subunit HisH [Alkalihalobacillus clausii]|uniref:imidazole glycerol phosphate synthase subunit HisH n=1 Tax=Shouchella clausii TaxID=79880 RepID=UPI000BA5EB32|nr:imidazole glycerol phosphate synthase subunit HisH [Shouchella clausii]MCM3551149.1 imidazole glycerol phosphate synthase subunit HisH [Shouchella clausii]PAF12592.1 imidazole glycerol phosphate synthase subunit HisH [Shouchella clausii]
MIGIIDYGMGNLHSVSKALERLAIPYFISSDGEELTKAKALILPGVGAFPDAMDILTQTNVQPFLDNWVAENKPLLGICLGMQLLFESSTEHQPTAGLGYLPGRVERFSGTAAEGHAYKVPHMGWNKLEFHRPTPLTEGVPEGYVYFVHSYVVRTETDIIVASSDYYQSVPAIVQKGQVYGMQFHPEKSSTVGMALLKRFGQLVEGN